MLKSFLSCNSAPRILILRGGALGDFILTIPAIAALRRRWPKAYLELVGYEKNAGLALTVNLIDRLQSLDSARMALYFQKERQLSQSEKKYIRSFDLIVSYLHDPDGIVLKHLKESGVKKVVAVSPIVRKSHAADHFCYPLLKIIGRKYEKPARLEWPQSLRPAARNRLLSEVGEKQVIIIHPGSGSPGKNWPAGKFALLAKKIRNESSFEPIIIGGEADRSAIAIMRSSWPDFHIVEHLPLPDIASILSVAKGFVGNDSGITHLAAALGIPVIALFGPTDPAIWAPRGKNVSVIKSRSFSKASLAEVAIDDVFRVLFKAIGGLASKDPR